MRNGFGRNGVGRFMMSCTAIAAIGLGIGAFGPSFLAWVSKPAQAQDVLVPPKNAVAPDPFLNAILAPQPAARNTVIPVEDTTVYPSVASVQVVGGLDEPLVAGGPTSPEEDAALQVAINAFVKTSNPKADFPEIAAPFLAFVAKYPNSNWNTAILTNLGIGYVRAAYYSRAIDAFDRAWVLGRDSKLLEARQLADRTFGELVRMHARIGHADKLEALFNGLGSRTIGQTGLALTQGAREGLSVMRNRPEIAYLCGPRALLNVLVMGKSTPAQIKVLAEAKSGDQGFNLTQLSALATQAGMPHKLIKRAPGQPIPVPSVVHWGVNHYAAITEEFNGRFHIEDGTFMDSTAFVTRAAIDAEASGYFLVPDGAKASAAPAAESVQSQTAKAATQDWTPVTAGSPEADTVHGMGYEGGTQNGMTELADATCMHCRVTAPPPPPNEKKNSQGMTVVDAHLAAGSLNMRDTPVSYGVTIGPSTDVTLSFAQYDYTPDSNLPYFNTSTGWALSVLSFLRDLPGTTGEVVQFRLPGGGYRRTDGYDTTTGRYNPDHRDLTQVVKVSESPTVYERRYSNGSIDRYAWPYGGSAGARLVFLTQRIDPQGNAINFSYTNLTGTQGSYTCNPACVRLNTVTDAAGKVTTFGYTHPTNPFLITSVTDPFGRVTTFGYNANKRLLSITDPAGIVSSFTYGTKNGGTYDNATSVTTPYGTTTFDTTGTTGNQRVLQITDPLGGVQRLETGPTFAAPITAIEAATPVGMTVQNQYLDHGNSFYFDAMVLPIARPTPGGTIDYTKAEITHWFSTWGMTTMSRAVGSIKHPLENRIWFNEPSQNATPNSEGDYDAPSKIGRVLDDGTTQLSQFTWNLTTINPLHRYTGNGVPLTATDPLGRTTKLNYAANMVDVTSVQQQISATPTWATLASYTYDANHNVTSVTDAAGQVWNYAYNTAGQMLYATNPLNETRFWEYDSSGRITRVTTPVAVAFASVVYGTTNTTAPTATSYNYSSPCAGVTASANTNLPISVTDSEGYTLCYQYDPLDRVTVVKYPDGTTDQYDYTFPNSWPIVSARGTQSLDVWKVTDRLGRVVNYAYDQNRRLISKSETVKVAGVDVTRTTGYSYYANGVLKELTDANGAVTHWEVDIQSRPTSKTYAYGTVNARTESYTYDLAGRLKTRTDALGQTITYTYNKDNSIASYAYTNAVVATPGASFSYDPWYLRRTGMTDQNGTTTWTYKAVGSNGALALDTEDGPFANDTITYGYDAAGRVNSRTIPGGSAESLSYDLLGHLSTHGTDLGSFTYGYLGNSGQVTSRTIGSIVTSWGYDSNTNDRRLLTIGTTGAVGRNFTYTSNAYQITGITDTAPATHPWLSQTWSYSYDASDRLLTGNGSIAGNSSFGYDKLDNATNFAGVAASYNNLNQVSLFNGATFAYDANGNLTSDGAKTYTYDAADHLLTVTQGSAVTTFGYDGLGRRVKRTYTNGTSTETRYLWCGAAICQTRDGSDTVTAKLFTEGEYRPSGTKKYLYLTDHLGSVRDVIDLATTALVAAFDYTPYGAIARSYGSVTPLYQWAMLMADPNNGLYISVTRAYNPLYGKWINRDPIKESGGINLYGYVGASPLFATDPLGLATCKCQAPESGGNRLDSGEKICTYTCTCTGCQESFTIDYSAGSSGRAMCIGQVDGEWTNPGGAEFKKFTFETGSIVQRMSIFPPPNGFIDKVEEELKRRQVQQPAPPRPVTPKPQ